MRPSLGAQGNEGSEQGRFINVRVGKGRQPAPPFTAVPECGQPEGRAPKQEIEECSAEIHTGQEKRLPGPDGSSYPHTGRPLIWLRASYPSMGADHQEPQVSEQRL